MPLLLVGLWPAVGAGQQGPAQGVQGPGRGSGSPPLGLAATGADVPAAYPPKACEASLWGCREGAAVANPEAKYELLCKQARDVLQTLQSAGSGDLGDSIAHATEATQLLPAHPLGWALLGLLLIEARRIDEAGPFLTRAAALAQTPPAPPTVQPAPAAQKERMSLLDSQLDLQVGLGVALWLAHRGELAAAEEQTRRLLLRRGPSHRALWRLGDLLMAQGRLEEATALYGRACRMPRPMGGLVVEVARSCYALAVALDRGQRAESAAALSRATLQDRDRRALLMPDFFPAQDRDYYRALSASSSTLAPPVCLRVASLTAYLSQARERPETPGSYIRRAEQLQKTLGEGRCGP